MPRKVIYRKQSNPPLRKRWWKPGLCSWIKTASYFASALTLVFVGWQFWYHNIREVQSAQISIVGIERYPWLKTTNKLITVKCIISNDGTEPIFIRQLMWVLSDNSNPLDRSKRRIQYTYHPEIPVKILPSSIEAQDFSIYCDRDTCGFTDLFNRLSHHVPDVLRKNPNFQIFLYSSLVVCFNDSHGDVHQVPIALGIFGLSYYGYSVGDIKFLPKKTQLLPSANVTDYMEMYNIWSPATYCNINNFESTVDTTGWYLSENAKTVFERLVKNGEIVIK